MDYAGENRHHRYREGDGEPMAYKVFADEDVPEDLVEERASEIESTAYYRRHLSVHWARRFQGMEMLEREVEPIG